MRAKLCIPLSGAATNRSPFQAGSVVKAERRLSKNKRLWAVVRAVPQMQHRRWLRSGSKTPQ